MIACPVAVLLVAAIRVSVRHCNMRHALCTIHDATCNAYIPCNVYHPAFGMLRLPVHRVHGPPVPHQVVLCCNVSCCVATCRAVFQRVVLCCNVSCCVATCRAAGRAVHLIHGRSVPHHVPRGLEARVRAGAAPANAMQCAPPQTRTGPRSAVQSWRADRDYRFRCAAFAPRCTRALQPSWPLGVALQVRARDGLRVPMVQVRVSIMLLRVSIMLLRALQVRARDGLRRAVCGAPVEGVLHLDHHVGADHGDRGFVDRRR